MTSTRTKRNGSNARLRLRRKTHFHEHRSEEVDRELIKRRLLLRRLQEAEALAARLRVLPDGRRVFQRFGKAERYQHFILMTTFSTLAVTGLLQHFSHYLWVAALINGLGGVEALRVVHRLAAVGIMAVSFYHVWRILELWFVKRRHGAMWPRFKDFKDLLHAVKYNIGWAEAPPRYGRFAVPEKLEYWALLWGQTLMVVTGLIMWFPIAATKLLPGSVIPLSLALHAWEAILATLAILTWHAYHVHVKVHNWSIFTGYMTEEEMQEEHLLEYQNILAARETARRIREELALLDAARQAPRKHSPQPPLSRSEVERTPSV